jgi:hypothetical protein
MCSVKTFYCTWGSSPLCKDANFHSHLPHAENQLPHSPTPNTPLHPTESTLMTHFNDSRGHRHAGFFFSPAHEAFTFYILTVRNYSVMTYLDKFSFLYFEKAKWVKNVIEIFCLLLLKADIQANPGIFF